MKRILLLALLAAALTIPAAAEAATPSITTGTDHACAVDDAGKAFCWGANARGQLGTGNLNPSPTALAVQGLPASVVSIAGGDLSTCALLADQTVWCWGDNTAGELGSGTADGMTHPAPAKVTSLSGVTQMSGGKSTYCALLADATARCWGGNSYGEIGNGTSGAYLATPTSPTGLTSVKQIAAGYAHTCAIRTDGTGRCWGYNAGGILGDGTTNPSLTPVVVSGLSGAVLARLGGYTSCAILGVGAVNCWGASGLIGIGSGGSTTPAQVSGITAGAVALGGSNVTNCAVFAPNGVKCWGTVPGNGSEDANTPVDVTGGAGAIAVSSNGFNSNTCIVSRGGGAGCWGSDNASGQLGNGSTSASPTYAPVAVSGLDLVTGKYAAQAVSLARSGKTLLDKKKKTYSQSARLRAELPPLLGADSCGGTAKGTVAYSYKTTKRVHGKKKKVTVKKTATASAPLTAEGYACVAQLKYKLPVKYLNHKKIAVKATWPGNDSLAAFSAASSKFTLPKVKVKKK